MFKEFNKRKYLYLGVILFLLVGGYYWRSSLKKPSASVEYKTITAEKGVLIKSITASGNVIVDQDATIDPTITGTVRDLAVNVGDKVKKGQFLFTVENDDLDVEVVKSASAYIQAQNSLDSAKLSVKEAKADYSAAKNDDNKTSKQKKVMKDKIVMAENAVVLAQKNLEAARISNQNVLKDSSKRKVTSSIDGTVNEINIKNGDDLSKTKDSSGGGSNPPMVIGDLSTLKASISVNEVDIPNISVGQKANLTFDAMDSLNIIGTVEKIDSLGMESSGVVTYDVTIDFDSLNLKIMPNMSVTASIIVESKSDILAIPTSVIKTSGNDNYVEVLNGDMTEKKFVQIGISNDTETEITNGLSVGDKIITQSIDNSENVSSSASRNKSSSSSYNRGMMGGGIMGGGPLR